MFESFARKIRRKTSPIDQHRPLGIEKQVSHRLWTEAKQQATSSDGQIDVRRAMTLFDELVLREHARLQSQRIAELVPPRSTQPEMQPAARDSQASSSPPTTRFRDIPGDTHAIGAESGPVLRFAALCSTCGKPAIEGTSICWDCAKATAAKTRAANADAARPVPENISSPTTGANALNLAYAATPAPDHDSKSVSRTAPEFKLFDFDPKQNTAPENRNLRDDFPFNTPQRVVREEVEERSPRRLQIAIAAAALVIFGLFTWRYIVHAAGFVATTIRQEIIGTPDSAALEATGQPSGNQSVDLVDGANVPHQGRTRSKPAGAVTVPPTSDDLLQVTPAAGNVPAIPAPALPLLRASVQIPPKDASAMLIREVAPAYPKQAQAEGIVGGHVTLRVTVDGAGRVAHAEPTSGNDILINSAMAAVKLWRYRPYVLDGKSSPFETMVIVDFSLSSPNH